MVSATTISCASFSFRKRNHVTDPPTLGAADWESPFPEGGLGQQQETAGGQCDNPFWEGGGGFSQLRLTPCNHQGGATAYPPCKTLTHWPNSNQGLQAS